MNSVSSVDGNCICCRCRYTATAAESPACARLACGCGCWHSPLMHKYYSSKWRSTGPHACCCAARTAQSGGTSARILPCTSITSHTSTTIDTILLAIVALRCAYSAQFCLATLRLSHNDPSCMQDALLRALVGSRRQTETDNLGAQLSSSMC